MGRKAAIVVCLLSLALVGCGEASPQPAENTISDLDNTGEVEGGTNETEAGTGEPEEIILAVNDPSRFESVAEAFEERYSQYQITILSPGSSGDPSQFHQDIKAAVESGQGPDILDDSYVDALDYAQAGYIQPWGEIFDASEQEDFLPGILDTGRIEGILYGVPYMQFKGVLITTQSRIGSAEDWNQEQMMQLVENSGAERLASRLAGSAIIDNCALIDKTDNPYIDWQKGTCDFTGENFAKLLRFAREYGDPEYVVLNEVRCRRVRKGEDFAEQGLRCLEDMSLYDAVLDGETVYMGYPTGTGAKIIISTSMLFCNGASEKKAGATEFLRFLLSEEQQNQMIERMVADQYTDVTCSSVRIDTIEHCLELERQKNQEPTNIFYEINQIYYYRNGITEKQEQQFREIQFPEQGEYSYRDLYTDALSGYVWDILSEYMGGTLTEEEAAEQMQFRVESFFAELKTLKLQQ